MQQLSNALRYASEQHINQRRKDSEKTPYINHPIEVMNILTLHNILEEKVLISALLHDVIEDTKGTFEEISNLFGIEVANIVLGCSDNKNLDKLSRKKSQIENSKNKSIEIQQVKLADKISNVKSIKNSPPKGWNEERILGYLLWCKEVSETMKDSSGFMYETFLIIYNPLFDQYNRNNLSEEEILETYYNSLKGMK